MAVVAVLLVALVALLAWGILHRQRLDEDSSVLAIQVSQAILERGEAGMLLDNAHPELLQAMSAADLRAYLASIPARLGPLQAITAISGSSDFSLSQIGDPATADYSLEARFRRSEAQIEVGLRQLEGRWLISAFSVAAPALYN